MGRENAVRTIFIIVIYFFVLTSVFSLIGVLVNQFGIDNDIISSEVDSLVTNYCTAPRSVFDYNSEEVQLSNRNTRCRDLYLSQIDCPLLEGCSWVASSTWFGFFQTGGYCGGNLDTGYYNDTTSITQDVTGRRNVCTNFDHTPDTCTLMGCTWITSDGGLNELEEVNVQGFASIRGGLSAVGTFFSTMGSLITFRLNFNTGTLFLDGVLYFIFILLPLLVFIGNAIVLVIGG